MILSTEDAIQVLRAWMAECPFCDGTGYAFRLKRRKYKDTGKFRKKYRLRRMKCARCRDAKALVEYLELRGG